MGFPLFFLRAAAVLVWPSVARRRGGHPSHDTRDAVYRDHRTVGNLLGGFVHAEHHRNAALTRERSEVGRAAAALGDNRRHSRQDVRKRRTRRLRDEHFAGVYRSELAFTIDDTCAAGAPADTRRVSVQTRVVHPDLVRHSGRFGVQRSRLKHPEAALIGFS